MLIPGIWNLEFGTLLRNLSGAYVVALGIKSPFAVITALKVAIAAGPALHEGSVVNRI